MYMTLPSFLGQGGFEGWTEALYVSTTTSPQSTDSRDVTDPELAFDPFNTRGSGLRLTRGNPILRTDIFSHYGFILKKQGYDLFPLPSSNPDQQGFASDMSLWLHNVYSWNPIQESGALTLKGNPNIRIGQHLLVAQQNREFYVESVTHKFAIWPQPQWITSVEVTRGLWLSNMPYPEAKWL